MIAGLTGSRGCSLVGRLGLTWWLGVIGLAACDPCGESRYVETRGVFAPASATVETPDTGTVVLSFGETKGAYRNGGIDWRMDVSAPVEEVIAIHLHEGGRFEVGDVLVALPETAWTGRPTVVVGTSFDYDGSWDHIYDLLRGGRVYVDIHTTAHPNGAVRADLGVVSYYDWKDFYCS